MTWPYPSGITIDAAVALDRREHRERDARVARGRLDDRAAGTEQSPPLRVRDHRAGDAVLHAPTGVEPLELGEDPRRPAGETRELDERRRSDGILERERAVNFCGR